jgi:hypothetical protein
MFITKEYLSNNPDHIFVFGDNVLRYGYGGAASLRDMKNTYGFITKRKPNNEKSSFYKPDNYKTMFAAELLDLETVIQAHPERTYLISKLGDGLANKYKIWEEVIKDGIRILEKYPNVKFLFKFK